MTRTDFEYTGQLVATRSNIGLLIQPDDTGITDSIIRVQTTVGSPTAPDALVVLDPSLQSIEDTEFYFHEVNTSYFGIQVRDPTTSTWFRNNFIRTAHNHAHRHTALSLGQSQLFAGRVNNNRIEARTFTDGFASNMAVQVWGNFNTIDMGAYNPGQQIGIRFEPGSSNNTLTHVTIEASIPIIDLGTANTCNGGGCGGALVPKQHSHSRQRSTHTVGVDSPMGEASSVELVTSSEASREIRLSIRDHVYSKFDIRAQVPTPPRNRG